MTADRKQFNRKVTNKVIFTLSNVQFKNAFTCTCVNANEGIYKSTYVQHFS